MTKDELQELLQQLGLDYSAEANQIYVFYVRPDGRVDNFSVSVRRGTSMSDGEILGLMRREYPASRDGAVLGVERPEGGAANGLAASGRHPPCPHKADWWRPGGVEAAQPDAGWRREGAEGERRGSGGGAEGWGFRHWE